MTRRSWTSIAACVAVGLALSGCALFKPRTAQPPHIAIPPPPVTQPAQEPQAPSPKPPPPPPPAKVSCVPKTFPRAPKYPDTDAALRDAGGAADRYQLMAAGRLLRDKRLQDLEKTVDACR